MKVGLRILWGICCGVSFLALLTGCAELTSRELTTKPDPTDYNIVDEKAQNEMLLLNIVRASKRRPMYFTSVADFKGSSTYSLGTGSITIPMGKPESSVYSIAPTATFTTNPIVDINVLDKKEFLKGILTAVPLDILHGYWLEGWNREMLLNLFVQRITIRHKTKLRTYIFPTYQNYTALHVAYNNYSAFQTIIRKYKDYELLIKKDKTPIGPKIVLQNYKKVLKKGETVVKPPELKDIADGAQKAGLVLEPTEKKDGFQLYKETTDYYFMCNDTPIAKIVADDGSDHRDDKVTSNVDTVVYLTLRSPEGILYYLGQIMRYEIKNEATKPEQKFAIPQINLGTKPVKLFLAREKKTDDQGAFVTVDYEGTQYVIPKTSVDANDWDPYANNSMQVLSLISLLIDRQRIASEEPSPTGTVSLIH